MDWSSFIVFKRGPVLTLWFLSEWLILRGSIQVAKKGDWAYHRTLQCSLISSVTEPRFFVRNLRKWLPGRIDELLKATQGGSGSSYPSWTADERGELLEEMRVGVPSCTALLVPRVLLLLLVDSAPMSSVFLRFAGGNVGTSASLLSLSSSSSSSADGLDRLALISTIGWRRRSCNTSFLACD